MARGSGGTGNAAHRRCTDCTVAVHRDAAVAARSASPRESRSIGIGYSRNGNGAGTSGNNSYATNFDQGEGTAD